MIYMIGFREGINREVEGFRLFDTDTMRFEYREYSEVHSQLKLGKIDIKNLRVEAIYPQDTMTHIHKNILVYKIIDDSIVNESGSKLLRYPRIIDRDDGETYYSLYRTLILIGINRIGEYGCVDGMGVPHVLSKDEINQYTFNIVNDYILSGGDGDLDIIDIRNDLGHLSSGVEYMIERYKIKCNLLGIKEPLIKNINGNITLVAGNKTEGKVIIPSFVTHIGDSAFWGCSRIETINIHENIKNVGNGAFRGCGRLKEIVIPESVEYIGNRVFSNSGIVRAEIRSDIKNIPMESFNGCRELIEVKLPDTLVKIGSKAFGDCGKLRLIGVYKKDADRHNDGDRSRGRGIGIEFPSKLKIIGKASFMICEGITELYIPDTVEEIEKFAFWGCTGLRKLRISNNMRVINESIFMDTSLESVEIPEVIQELKASSFGSCNKIKNILIKNKNIKIDKDAFLGSTELTSIKIRDN